MRTAVIAFIIAVIAIPTSARASTCRDMGQSVLDLSQAISDLNISSLDAGLAALELSGTRARYGPTFKRVEDDAAKADTQFLAAMKALGDLQAFDVDKPAIASATSNLLGQARLAIQVSSAYKGFALAYERSVNSRNRTLARQAFAAAMGSMPPSAYSYSNTYGTVYGNSIQATTTTTTTISDPGASWRAAAYRYQQDAQSGEVSRDELESYLLQYKATIQMLPYDWFPLTKVWVNACRAAGELPQ